MSDDDEKEGAFGHPEGGSEPDPFPDETGTGRDKLVFHYNREHRLAHAPETVQRAYAEGYMPNRGFLKGLTANAGLKSILAVIVILSALILFLTITDIGGTVDVGGISVRAKAFLFEDKVYITLTCEENSSYTGAAVPLTAQIQSIDRTGNVIDEREIAGAWDGKQVLLRTVMQDHDTASVKVLLKVGESDSIIAVSVDRK